MILPTVYTLLIVIPAPLYDIREICYTIECTFVAIGIVYLTLRQQVAAA
jgi:hypothetical protein